LHIRYLVIIVITRRTPRNSGSPPAQWATCA